MNEGEHNDKKYFRAPRESGSGGSSFARAKIVYLHVLTMPYQLSFQLHLSALRAITQIKKEN